MMNFRKRWSITINIWNTCMISIIKFYNPRNKNVEVSVAHCAHVFPSDSWRCSHAPSWCVSHDRRRHPRRSVRSRPQGSSCVSW